jgi:hypothetical protein
MTAITLGQFTTLTSRGASETAGFIATQLGKWRRQLQCSYALGQEAKGSLNELYQVFNECRNSNWDTYGAKPVSEEILQFASQLLEALPLGTPAPSLGAEPDGQITLEWHRSPRRTLSVSVSQEGDLHYAALIGAGRHYGTEPFYGEAPKIILDLIRRVLAA